MDDMTADALEQELAAVSLAMTQPYDDECVLCYAYRMVLAFGCDRTLRWVRRWRDLRRPRATGIERRMRSRGGFCDCEVFSNGWTLREELMEMCPHGDLREPDPMPECAGAGPRSTQPCTNWVTWGHSPW
jgi:hypothetical protein